MSPNSRRNFLQIASATVLLGCTPSVAKANSFFEPQNRLSAGDDLRAFFDACRRGNVTVVRQLVLADRALLTATDADRLSGFAVALLNGQNEVVEQLAALGYECDLHEAALAGNWERLDLLAGKIGGETAVVANSDHPIGGTAMFAAVAGGAGADTWRIYALGGEPDHSPRGPQGVTPLQKALRFADLPVAELTAASLLSNNTNPNPAPNADAPPLHIAAERGSLEMTEMLIRLGAKIDAADADGRTALQLAEQNGHAEVAKMIENHLAIPRTCRTSRTAFDIQGRPYAAPDISDIPGPVRRKMVGNSHGNLDYVRQAISAEPRLAHSVDVTSEICVEACAHIGRKPIVEFLLEHGAPYSLPTAVMMGDFETVRRYLSDDPNRIHERGAHDFGLLWYPAIGQCDLEMTRYLLDQGALVEQQHYLGTTALHWACMRGTVELAALLLENGANINRVARKFRPEGETPLAVARRSNNPDVIQLLLDRGAK